MLIRLLTFHSAAPGEITDHFVRRTILPGLIGLPGLRHAFAARGGEDGDMRVVLSIWESDGQVELGAPLDCERDDVVADPRVELVPASVALSLAPPDDALILRIFRGKASERQGPAYLEAVREGTVADVAAGKGPLALFLGMIDDERFVTTSVWSDWQRIEDATGGNIHQPIATRHRDLLVEGSAEHLEIVPDATVQPAEGDRPAWLGARDDAPSA